MYDASYLFHHFHERERSWLSGKVRDMNEADEILSDAYVKAVAFIATGKPIGEPSPWFRRVVRNCWIDMIKYRRRQKRPDAHTVELSELAEDLSHAFVQDDFSERVLCALNAEMDLDGLVTYAALNDMEREVLLRSADGFSRQELAADMSLRPQSVESLLASAWAKLRAVAGGMSSDRSGVSS